MDIHRCRFVPFPPGAINAIAFSHPRPDTKAQINNVRVAIGRDNGDIELWNPRKGDWQQEKIIFGGKDRSIDSLAWITGPDRKIGDASVVGPMRLFSTGYTSTVTEWDIVEGKPRSHASGPHADIWCMASISNTNSNATGNKSVTPRIVVGTVKGELAMYSVKDDELRFDKIIARSTTKGMKMLSVAFQNPRTVVVGCSDGTIRVYDILKGMLLRKMTLGADLTGGAREIIVWAVKCLPGGDIVSADSSGQICIWDGRTYTQAQRIQSHDQDALSLACSMDGNVIVSGGMDRRTIIYKKNSGTNRWSRVWGRRYHEHDVKTLATFEVADTSVVMAGGPDATPVLIPLKEAGMENHRRLPMLPHRAPLQSAPASRLIVSWWGQEVHIWTLRKSFDDLLTEKSPDDKDVRENWKLLKNILIKDDSNITSASISADGTLLVVATNMSIKAFKISFSAPLKPSAFHLASVPLPESIGDSGAQTVKISPDGTWLAIVRGCDSVFTAPIVKADDSISIGPAVQRLKRFARDAGKTAGKTGLGRYDRSIVQVAFSADSNMFAAADLAGYVDTWIVKSALPAAAQTNAQDAQDSDNDNDNDDQDAADAAWVQNPRGALLPKLAGSPSALAFSEYSPSRPEEAFSVTDPAAPADDYTLLAVTANFHVTSFNPLRGTLTRWARRNHRSALPVQMQETRDLVKGIMWEGQRAWLYGISFVFMLDMAQDLERPVDANGKRQAAAAADEASRKRKRSAHDSGAGGKMARGTLGPVAVSKQTTGSAAVTEVFEYDAYRRSGAKSAAAAVREDGGDDEEDEENESDGEVSELAKRRAQDLRVQAAAEESDKAKAKAFGYTFKYRHILGLVPLATGAKDGGIEVALVERPLWEVDLPERSDKSR
ncbi:hypothetical protein TD95_000283 [Thielaviopsis punctulata]|uniref:Uncharacterized protein n=1 Tax=Thielaviopsis punctulata TaxID=72032 RepID=A0A0F4ZE08_9PEZI|nr:hypothetical protein TD95_000283 [Thielaviopsis punctulata]